MSGFVRPHCLNRDACAAKSPVTHCRRCSILRVQADPELEAKRRAGIGALFADPVYVAEHRARLQASVAKASQDPAFIERRRAHGLRQYRDCLSRPDVQAKAHGPDARKRAGRATSETRLAWCPVELRAEYRRLIRSKLIPAAEARRIIEAEIAGTVERGKRELASNILKLQLKHERDLAEAY
jgi:hypothetical protein